jgi:hypothetical protein
VIRLPSFHEIDATTGRRYSAFQLMLTVKFRITHPKKLVVEHCVIMTSGVIGQDAPATLDAVSDPVGQTNAARTRLAVLGYRYRAICLRLGQATRQSRY